jgi:uncharacterized protein YbjT (DUF2867 family)
MPPLPRRELICTLAAASVASIAHAQDMTPAPPLSFAGQTMLVAGGTGRIGRFVVAKLLSSGARVRAFARDVRKAKAELPQVEWLAADMRSAAALKGIVRGVDRVLCAIGTNGEDDPSNTAELVEFKGVAALASEAKASGAKQFVLLSANAVGMTDLTAKTPFAATMRFKRQGEEALAASGVPYTIIRPMSLWDRPGGEFGIALIGHGLRVSGVMCREDVAAVMVCALSTEKAFGKTIHCFNIAARDVHAWMRDFPALAES